MNSYYGLSEIEYELMQLFWQSDKELFFAEIVRYCNEQKGHDWAQTTIHTYLSRLIQKMYLLPAEKVISDLIKQKFRKKSCQVSGQINLLKLLMEILLRSSFYLLQKKQSFPKKKLIICINFLMNSFQMMIHRFKCRRKFMPLLTAVS